ncbi:MAG: hypothetical protein JWO05_885 [Gemmatimonadetes bacterium]|nr:hypothetical protein [Gemmatimonadota bacterium]
MSSSFSFRTCFAVAVLVASAQVVVAQAPVAQAPAARPATWEFRATSGGLVPIGSQRAAIKRADYSAAQLSWLARPALAITGTLGWARSRDLAATNDPRLDVFTYDVGAEARTSQWFAGKAVTFTPFVGAGAGARSYNYRSLDVDATHNLAAYGAAGGELGMGRVGVRLEVRDYTSGFKPLAGGGTSERRNDVVIMAGLRLRKGA